MINRDDMLELTRRMTPSRTCFTRIAGSYRDRDGYEDGSFNVNFLKLDANERAAKIALAKTIPFAETNVKLKEYSLEGKTKDSLELRTILLALKDCGLKNDALMENFYEVMTSKYKAHGDFGIFLYYGAYDVPVKASDKEVLEDSEIVYDFLICVICPVDKEYEPGEPEFGFLYPAFKDRSSDEDLINIYRK